MAFNSTITSKDSTMRFSIRNSLRFAAAATAAMPLSLAIASSHSEAPFIKSLPKVDATDFYIFNSYEPGREDYVTIVANYWPLQLPGAGPSYFSMDPNAIYEIHVDNNGDAVEDLTFQFKFDNNLANGGNGITVPVNGVDVAIPLQHAGAISAGNVGALNFLETYSLTMINGDRRSGTKASVTDTVNNSATFIKPWDNVGDKTYVSDTGNYDDYVVSTTNSGQAYNIVNFAGCPSGADTGRVFVGQRQESFSLALGEIFDLVNFSPLAGDTPDDESRNEIADYNITSLAIEVHKDCLTGAGNGVIGAWTTSSIPQVRIMNPAQSFETPEVVGGAWTQVSRLSAPLVNEVVIGLPDKDKFNSSEPKDDAQFATYVTNPTLPFILDLLFRDAVGADSNIAPSNFPRNDLVTAFLTGFAGVNQLSTVTGAEMLRLNTALAATPRDEQSNFGVVAGDLAGFPNGRRPGDDEVDIALRVVMGALCHPVDCNATDDLNLCDPEDAPVGTAAFTDGAPQNALRFGNSFPYLNSPLPGSPQTATASAQ